MSTHPLPGDLVVSPDAAAALTADAAGWKVLTLSPEDAGRVDMVIVGALPNLVELPAPSAFAASGDSLALRDSEGVLLAVMGVTSVVEGGVRGEVAGIRRPTRPDHHDLWRAPAPYPPGAVAVIATTPPLTAELDALDGPAIVLVLAGTDPLDPLHHRRVARWRELTLERGLPLVLLPLSTVTEAEAIELAATYGATRGVADPMVADGSMRERQSHGGICVFFTGLSGSGKSTVASLLAVQLAEAGRSVTLLDGDVVRTHLSQGLSFSKADRETNIRRIGWVAAEVTKHGGIAVCAPIAPYAATRAAARKMVERYGRFVLVHVSTPLEVCEARDRKGLYAKARSGELAEFTGISDPYEAPLDANLVLDTSEMDVEQAVSLVLAVLAVR